MRFLYFLFFIVFVTSCGEESTNDSKKDKKGQKREEVPMPLYSGEMVFSDEFVTSKKFSNGDVIRHAQSKLDWADAAKNGVPAWCYADSIYKQGVLYNGYCISDEREISKDVRYLNEIDAALFGSVFDAPEVTEVPIYLIERNYQGNFYNLGFQNIWVKGSKERSGMMYVLSYHPSRAEVQLRKAHPGSGYFIRTLKK